MLSWRSIVVWFFCRFHLLSFIVCPVLYFHRYCTSYCVVLLKDFYLLRCSALCNLPSYAHYVHMLIPLLISRDHLSRLRSISPSPCICILTPSSLSLTSRVHLRHSILWNTGLCSKVSTCLRDYCYYCCYCCCCCCCC